MPDRLEKLIEKTTPRYNVTLPLSKRKLTYRPFLVKEEKVLLISTADLDQDDIAGRYKAIILLLENCTDLNDIGSLSPAEVDWLFVQIRARSVNNIVKASYTSSVGNASVEVDLEHLEIDGDFPDPLIPLRDGIEMILSPPSLDDILECGEGKKTDNFCLLKKCLNEIRSKDDIIKREEMSEEDINSFIDSLSVEHLDKTRKYFNNLPSIKKEITVKHENSEESQTIILSGIRDLLSLCLSHMSLSAYYEINFALMQHHNYSLHDLESMIPWERDVYITYLKSWLEEQKQEQQKRMKKAY